MIPECLQSQLDIVSLLSRRQVLKLSEARMMAQGVIPPVTKRPSGLNLAHCPHLVDILRQLIFDILNKCGKLNLRRD